MEELRYLALQALYECNPQTKSDLVTTIDPKTNLDCDVCYEPKSPIPGRPDKPVMVDPKSVPVRSVHHHQGHAAMIHAIAHIEFNAINLALDLLWRFPHLPPQFYLDWLQVAQEEVYHFNLIVTHLQKLGYQYGDFPAHNGLWDMAEKTQDNLISRLALVPRNLEARGLDVNPVIQDKLRQIKDEEGLKILDIILRDEIGHVRFGSYWFKYVCEQAKLDPETHYRELLTSHHVAKPRGNMNRQARATAGFSQNELTWLSAS